jgi:hypothetical protein
MSEPICKGPDGTGMSHVLGSAPTMCRKCYEHFHAMVEREQPADYPGRMGTPIRGGGGEVVGVMHNRIVPPDELELGDREDAEFLRGLAEGDGLEAMADRLRAIADRLEGEVCDRVVRCPCCGKRHMRIVVDRAGKVTTMNFDRDGRPL